MSLPEEKNVSSTPKFELTVRTPIIHWIAPNQKGNFITCLAIDDENGFCIAGQCSGTINCWKIPTIIQNNTSNNNNSNNNNASNASNTNNSNQNNSRNKRKKRPKESKLESPMYTSVQLSKSIKTVDSENGSDNESIHTGNNSLNPSPKASNVSNISNVSNATSITSQQKYKVPSSPASKIAIGHESFSHAPSITVTQTQTGTHSVTGFNSVNSVNSVNSINSSITQSPSLHARSNKKRNILRLIKSKYNTFECLNLKEHDNDCVRHVWCNGFIIVALIGFRKIVTFPFKDFETKKFVYNKDKCHEKYISATLSNFFHGDPTSSRDCTSYFSLLTNDDDCIKIFKTPNVHKHISIKLANCSMVCNLDLEFCV